MEFHQNRTKTEIWIFYRTKTEPEPKLNTETLEWIFSKILELAITIFKEQWQNFSVV